MPNEWADGWDDDAGESDTEGLPPAYYNADAELARELDLAKIWEPKNLKFVETPFTIANRQRRESEAIGLGAAAAAKGKGKGKAAPVTVAREVIARPGENQNTSQPSRSSNATLTSTDRRLSPSPPPAPRRRGPKPAKSAKLFGVDPPDEKKEAARKAPKRWTKADAEGWQDAAGNHIPSTRVTAGKKAGAAEPKAKKSIVELMDEAAEKEKEKMKGGKGSRGKGKKGAEAEAEADLPDGPIKKKRAPRKKKAEDDDDEGEVKKVVKETKNAVKKKVEIVEVSDDDEKEGEEHGSESEPDSLEGLLKGRKRIKAKKGDTEEDGEPVAKKGKATAKSKAKVPNGKAKGKAKAKVADDDIVFTRLPSGAGPNDAYPIVKLLEHQKTLPTKTKSKATTKRKPAKASTKIPQVTLITSSSSRINTDDAEEFINSLSLINDDSGSMTVDDLLPTLVTSGTVKRKASESEGGESIDPEDTDGDDDRVILGREADDEESGKKGLLNRFIDGHQTQNGTTAPATLDVDFHVPDTSSALPVHSSPTERKAMRRRNSDLHHPQPIRRIPIPLPNADKFERLAKIAEKSRKEAEGRKEKKSEPDVTSYMRKGMTIAQPPMSAKRLRRHRSPQSQIDSHLRHHQLQPVEPNLANTDMFRSPSYHATQISAAGGKAQESIPWGTLGQKGGKSKKTPYSTQDDDPFTSGLNPSYTPARTISQLPKKGSLFTPKPPQFTVPPPKFRTMTNMGTGQYGSAASSRTEEAVLDPYKRAEMQAGGRQVYGMGVGNGRSLGRDDEPEMETLRGQTGTAYTIRKDARDENGHEERPRYMPAMAVSMGQAGEKGEGFQGGEDDGDWRSAWKYQPRGVEKGRGGNGTGQSKLNGGSMSAGHDKSAPSHGREDVGRNSWTGYGGRAERDRTSSESRERGRTNFGASRTQSSGSTLNNRPSSYARPRHSDSGRYQLIAPWRVPFIIPRSTADDYPNGNTHGNANGNTTARTSSSTASGQDRSYPSKTSTQYHPTQHVAQHSVLNSTFNRSTSADIDYGYGTMNGDSAYDDHRPDSRQTRHQVPTSARDSRPTIATSSRIGRIPIATFNGSKSRPSVTPMYSADPTYDQTTNREQSEAPQDRDWMGDAVSSYDEWRDMPEAGPSNYARYDDRDGLEGFRGGDEGYRVRGDMEWEEGRV